MSESNTEGTQGSAENVEGDQVVVNEASPEAPAEESPAEETTEAPAEGDGEAEADPSHSDSE